MKSLVTGDNEFDESNIDINNARMCAQKKYGLRVIIVAPAPPPPGGMAVQAQRLMDNLKSDGVYVKLVKTNSDFPKYLNTIKKIPLMRTAVNFIIFSRNLKNSFKDADLIYLFSGFKRFFFWVTFPALVIAKVYRKKVIISARGGAAEDFFKKWRFLVKPMLNLADKITVPSEFLQIVFLNILNYPTEIIPNIADLNLFTYKERNSFLPRVIVSRGLEKIYNIPCVIKAFELVKQRYESAELGIAGDGSEKNNLQKLVNELNLNGVKFYGALNQKELADLYSHYDIFINASNVDNFPGAIIEAFASGLPVVTTNSGGIPYIIKDEYTGFLVTQNNHEQLAEKIFFVIQNPDVAKTIAKNARNESEKYTWNKIKEQLFSIWRDNT